MEDAVHRARIEAQGRGEALRIGIADQPLVDRIAEQQRMRPFMDEPLGDLKRRSMKFGVQSDGAPERERGDAAERQLRAQRRRTDHQHDQGANLGRERGVRFFEEGKGLRDAGGEGGPLRRVGRPKDRPLLARIQQPDEAGGVLAERLGGERSDIEDRRIARRRGDSSPKMGGLIVALRLQGENELEICWRKPMAPADAP